MSRGECREREVVLGGLWHVDLAIGGVFCPNETVRFLHFKLVKGQGFLLVRGVKLVTRRRPLAMRCGALTKLLLEAKQKHSEESLLCCSSKRLILS